jgi:dCMP deaminase
MNKYHSEVWDRRFLDVAKTVSAWSKDPSSKLGAVVVDPEGRIVGTGYNGFPRGVEDTEERLNNRELKYEFVVHAEVNAIITAGDRARGSTLYVYPGWGSPCMCTNCCKTAIQSGIKRVVGLLRSIDAERLERWKASLALSQVMCDEAGIETVTYKELT